LTNGTILLGDSTQYTILVNRILREAMVYFLPLVSTIMLTRDIDIAFLPVCLYVRLSVTFWHYVETA